MTSSPSREADLAIVGLGALGSAAAYWASRRPGLRVVALEQYELGHPYGASEDVSRIVRLSYHRREYVRLARRALETWARSNGKRGGRSSSGRAGSMSDLARPRPAWPSTSRRTSRRWMPRACRSSASTPTRSCAAGRPGDWTSGTPGCSRRTRGWPTHPQGNAAHRELARAQGAELRDRTRVVDVAEAAGEVTIGLADGSRLRAGSVILATDAWTNELLAPLGLGLPLTVTQEQVSWFTPSGDARRFDPERFPIWIWMDEPSFYGFPTWSLGGPKIGQDVGGKPVTPATRTFDRDPDAWARTLAFLGDHLPAMAGGSVLQTKTCLYTLTPDRDFVLDRLPGHRAIVARARVGACVQVRERAGPHPRRARGRRFDAIPGRAWAVRLRPADPARSRPRDEIDRLSNVAARVPGRPARHVAHMARAAGVTSTVTREASNRIAQRRRRAGGGGRRRGGAGAGEAGPDPAPLHPGPLHGTIQALRMQAAMLGLQPAYPVCNARGVVQRGAWPDRGEATGPRTGGVR